MNKKGGAAPVPECPVCMEDMTVPIFQCKMGHSLCNNCTKSLHPPLCPICRQDMTQMRNWQLEDIISRTKVPCPNKSVGCVYTMENSELNDHIKECIFREMDCPLGAVFGKCSWSGNLKSMQDHFKERHGSNLITNNDEEVLITNVDINDDDRHFYLANLGKLIFIITVKIDTLQKMAYWTIQHIGSKKGAQQHFYEIHVLSKQDTRRKAIFADHCFNDAMKADDVFRLGKCAMMPLNALAHFIKDKKMSFRFFIKKSGPPPPKKENKNNNQQENAAGGGGAKPKQNQHFKTNKGPKPNKPQKA